MADKVFLVHGWSVQSTSTYRALHEQLHKNDYVLENIYLGRYVSLDNDIEIRDIARAMHFDLEERLEGDWSQSFHFITHSTGALIVKYWIIHYYIDHYLSSKPLKSVIHLAPPHFGSRLAHHGRSMLAHIKFLGDTGRKLLNALELGSKFSWEIADAWLDEENWREKGVQFYNLIGDRVVKNIFFFRIFPAHYEDGSDMVVRVPAGNMNFKRLRIDAERDEIEEVGRVEDVPFCALADFTHSGSKHGIMNSIDENTDPSSHRILNLILRCLDANDKAKVEEVKNEFLDELIKTRKKRKPFAQLDFRFRDKEGNPIEDFLFKLGYIKDSRIYSSQTVADCHKNKNNPSHFTVFIDLKELEPQLTYFIELDTKTDTPMVDYVPDRTRISFAQNNITDLIVENQTTQIEVIFAREPDHNLFVFHRGDDDRLHVSWNRRGEIK